MEQHEMAVSEAVTLIVTCLGIALGFIVVEILNKYIVWFFRKIRSKAKS